MLHQSAILFDLDGTLTDPRIGITRCIQHAMTGLGRAVPAEEALLWCIGPPLGTSFSRLLETREPDLIQQAVALYRERYATIGMYENTLYPGVPEMLAELRGRGCRILLATSKPRLFAQQILEYFKIDVWFDGIYGSELDGTRADKAELIAHILDCERLDPAMAVMVGDREHDAIGARRWGLACVGVTYGYGSEEELRAHGVTRFASCPGDIVHEINMFSTSVQSRA